MKLQMTKTELIKLWNEFCYDANYSDDVIYHNDEETLNKWDLLLNKRAPHVIEATMILMIYI